VRVVYVGELRPFRSENYDIIRNADSHDLTTSAREIVNTPVSGMQHGGHS
jgi:hypothetical protein